MHEASLNLSNSFITLTYNDENLPPGGTLNRKHFQDFMKRLRKKNPNVRVFYCGEYGDQLGRPHYHALLFGKTFEDRRLFKKIRGHPQYSSDQLTDFWGKGHATFGEVTFQSAAYVSRYVTKKVTGEEAEDHYTKTDIDGVVHYLQPEFVGMSLKPGIGQPWLEKWYQDIYRHDRIIMNGKAMGIPRAYDLMLEKIDPELLRKVRQRRLTKATNKALEERKNPSKQPKNSFNKFRAQDKNARAQMFKRNLDQ